MTARKPITVLLADDHLIVRQGLSALLNSDGNFRIVGEARTGREAVRLAHTLAPDVIVMDIAMPLLNGLEATLQILAANPAAKIVILSAHSDDEYIKRMSEAEYIKRMSEAGVRGFLEKQTSAEILGRALREVAEGRPFFSPSITKRLTEVTSRLLDRNGLSKNESVRLTSRESEVLQLVAEGSANKQIAGELGISIKTVEKHRQHLMNKLGIHDTAGLTRHAIASGVIESGVRLTIT
jgi:DNA-binding NarL/FixJ family response regulator